MILIGGNNFYKKHILIIKVLLSFPSKNNSDYKLLIILKLGNSINFCIKPD